MTRREWRDLPWLIIIAVAGFVLIIAAALVW
jgi:hypothetical protein